MNEREDGQIDPFGSELGRGNPFEAAIRSTPMPMIITDVHKADHPMVFVNEAFEAMSGYSRDELIGRDCRFLQGPDTDPDAVREIHDAIAAQRAIKIDLLNYRKDGSSFWNALHISPVHGDSGNVEYFVGSMMEVTHRVEAQNRISEQKALVETAVQERTAELERALVARTVLLDEVDHRVKNNLSMVGALLRLQSRSVPDGGSRQNLEEMLERIDALAGVNRQLYQSDDITRFDVGVFGAKLANDILGAADRRDIQLNADIDPVTISASKATAVGLVLNELLIGTVGQVQVGGNLALGIHHQSGHVLIDIRTDKSGIEMTARDVGTFRKTLVERLSRQINGTVEYNETSGLAISLCFPIDG